jgi:hypothetical protein
LFQKAVRGRHTARVSASLHYTHGPGFSVVEITALAFLEDAEPALREMAERTRVYGDRRLLINLMDVVGTFGPEQQRDIGLLAHRYLGHLQKVASLVPPEKVTHVSEAAARSHGLELRVFTTLADAVDWLLK